MWLCLLWDRHFEDTCQVKSIKTTYVTLNLQRQTIWGDIWKRIVKTNVTMHLLTKTLNIYISKFRYQPVCYHFSNMCMVGIWLCHIPSLHHDVRIPPGGNLTGGNMLGNLCDVSWWARSFILICWFRVLWRRRSQSRCINGQYVEELTMQFLPKLSDAQ